MTRPTICVLYRDKKPIAATVRPTANEASNAMFELVHKVQGQSYDWAMKHGGYCVHETMEEPRRYGDAFAADRWREHAAKYDALLGEMGRANVERAVLSRFTRDEILTALAEGDSAMNSLALARWDSLHQFLEPMGRRTSAGRCWALMETVCVAKECARQIAETV